MRACITLPRSAQPGDDRGDGARRPRLPHGRGGRPLQRRLQGLARACSSGSASSASSTRRSPRAGFAGIGIGAAMVGLRPIIEFMTLNFSLVAIDQIVNNAAKIRQMSRRAVQLSRSCSAARAARRVQVGAQHSPGARVLLRARPGLKVVDAVDAGRRQGPAQGGDPRRQPGRLHRGRDALRAEGRGARRRRRSIPLGKARHQARRARTSRSSPGRRWSHVALEAAEALAKEGIEAEVVDPRTLRPLDDDTHRPSRCARPHRCVVVEEGWPYGGVGAEIADRIQRLAFDELDAPIERVTHARRADAVHAKLEQLVHAAAPSDVVDGGRTRVART